jgi:hypothetical protein
MIDSLRWTRLLPYLPNPTLAPLQMGRRQSQLQRVQRLSNLQKINASNTENCDPRTSPTALLKTELEKQCARADDNARKLHNKAREAQRAKTARDVLRLEKRQLTHMSRMRASRVPNQKQLAVARALKQAAARPIGRQRRMSRMLIWKIVSRIFKLIIHYNYNYCSFDILTITYSYTRLYIDK